MFRIIYCLLISSVVGLVTAGVSAQGSQPKASPRPLATPPPTVTGAEIISRAGELVEAPSRSSTPDIEPRDKDDAETNTTVRELTERIKRLEANRKDPYDEKQKRMLLNLDILTRAEQRAESLRKQHFEMIEKESAIKTRLEQLEYDSRPEVIERTLQLSGSLRPEEVRDSRRRSIAAERTNLQLLLTEIEAARSNLADNVQRADQMVERLRLKLERDIENSFLKDDEPEN
ncbi:MAG: hypothetical protein IPM59_09705 [Chloracidobacterium sp.]|nr:hypothetical protein [Chloracidobacterium sp.]